MKTIYHLLPFVFILCLSGCGENNGAEFKNSDYVKLVGTWKQTERSTFETWSKDKDGLTGKGFRVFGQDTVVTEYLSINCKNGSCKYSAQVLNQNEGKPVLFTLQEKTDSKWIFVNPNHDFPQKIEYEFKNPALISVGISRMEGEPRTAVFKKVD